MNPDEKAAEARLRAVAASHWRDVDAVDHNDALRVGDIRIMLALLDEARAEAATYKQECASISAEFGLPPTIRPSEGEITRFLEDYRKVLAATKQVELFTRERDAARADYTAERERANEWLAQLHDARAEVARLRGQSPLLDVDPRPLTPEAFVAACKRCRPTKHLHGWHARELGAMVETLVRERDEARAEVERFRDGCERASIVGIAMRGEIDDLRAENARLRAAKETP
jgi:hypothetical protein